jgi:hypothetical protein
MKIVSQQNEGSVLCIMPNGELFEITMLEAEGEECVVKSDVQDAVELLSKHKNLMKLWANQFNK